MNAQERQLLSDFLQQLASVRGLDKDAEAEALIRQQCAQQPDALYLLVQRTLLQQQALQAAQARIQDLEQQVSRLQTAAAQAPSPAAQPVARGFLSGLSASDWGRPAQPQPAAEVASVPSTPTPGASIIGSQLGATPRTWASNAHPGQPNQAQGGAAAPGLARNSDGGGFLGQAAMAAAGVAGGMLLFNGIEHLLHGQSQVAQQQPEHASDPAKDAAQADATASAQNEHGNADAAASTPVADAGASGSGESGGDGGGDSGGWFDDVGFFGGGSDDEFV